MIDSFMGPYRFLSNFPDTPIYHNGHRYKNPESGYQAAKLGPEYEEFRKQYESTSGAQAKKLSKELKHLTRPDWAQISLPTMSEVLHCKYSQNREVRLQLIGTYPHVLIEGNTWHDNFYGVCRCGKKPECDGSGKNWLGRMEMAERAYWIDLASNRSLEGDPETHEFPAKTA